MNNMLKVVLTISGVILVAVAIFVNMRQVPAPLINSPVTSAVSEISVLQPVGGTASASPKSISPQPLPSKVVTNSGPVHTVVASSSQTSVSSHSQSKRLAFALLSLSNEQNVNQVATLLSNAAIDGVAIQIGWTSMETADGFFNWTTLDAVLKEAKDHNKNVTLHIFSGGPRGIAAWLKSAGVKTYTLTDFQGRTREEALPWDQTLLSQYSQFLKSLNVHLSSAGYLDTVARMSIAVPVSEMDLIACKTNMLASVYPYDRSAYLSSWKTMVDAYAVNFPSFKKFISAPVGLICFPDSDTQFFTDIMDYAFKNYGATFEPFAADLTAVGSSRTAPYTDLIAKLGVGYQPIWSSTNDPSNRTKGTYPGNLLQATCKAVAGGADYVEIYGVDVMNPDATIQKGIQAVHDATLCK